MVVKTTYSIGIGLWKSLKNVVIVLGIPALVLLLDNWTQIIPEEWNVYALPVIGFLSYMVKNYVQVKNE